jgi:hypothetical protein
VLSYNSDEAEPARAIEDLEMLNMDDDHKFKDWRMRRETSLNTYRKKYALFFFVLIVVLVIVR